MALDVSGVGYKIYTSYTTLESAELNKECLVYTYTHIREYIFDIYGFKTNEELSTFLLLISVSGVGPKAALSILSFMPTEVFAKAVVTNDISAITKSPGIGKKTAERIVLELKEKIEKTFEPGDIEISNKYEETNEVVKEAIDALIVLGYSNLEAKGAVLNVKDRFSTLEDIIKNALKLLMN